MNVQESHQYCNQHIALIGYGVTGKACADYLLAKGANLAIFDKADLSKQLSENHQQASTHKLHEQSDLNAFDQVVVSPGVNLCQAFIQKFKATGKSVIGDIELFAVENTCPVIAVTGSNGKSTVVDMLSKAIAAAGFKVGLGGNFGRSALTLLDQGFDYIVLELSSFQLESTHSLQPKIACVLNVSPDHIDRHGSMQAYTDAKLSIYNKAEHVIYNRDDEKTFPPKYTNQTQASFGLQQIHSESATAPSLFQNAEGIWINTNLLLNAAKIDNVNQHQLLNMQVVLACAMHLQLPLQTVVKSLSAYTGLAHRFERVLLEQGVEWINDSKATNPGACIAALESLVSKNKAIILIAGGDSKGADLSELTSFINQHVSLLILMVKDKHLFTHTGVDFKLANNISQCVEFAQTAAYDLKLSEGRDVAVLLSPACASIDMFDNYQHRGNEFAQAVNVLAKEVVSP